MDKSVGWYPRVGVRLEACERNLLSSYGVFYYEIFSAEKRETPAASIQNGDVSHRPP